MFHKHTSMLLLMLTTIFAFSAPPLIVAQEEDPEPNPSPPAETTEELLFLPSISYEPLVTVSDETRPSPSPSPSPLPPAQPLSVSNTDGRVAKELARRWALDDAVVANGGQQRIWYWGSQVLTSGAEPYTEAAGGKRIVWYFDKARMEIANPSGNPDDPWYITSGLPVDEMIAGFLQVGDHQLVDYRPADIPVTGDAIDPTKTITYSDLRPVATIFGENRSMPRPNELVLDTLGKDGVVTKNTRFSTYNVQLGTYHDAKGHNIPKVFTNAIHLNLILYLAGHPVSEPYWVTVPVAGKTTDVLVQAFDRRVLMYTPSNPSWSRVEWGNVGRHYAQWRYGSATNITPLDPRSILDTKGTARPLSDLSSTAAQWANSRPSTEGVAVFNMHTGTMYAYNDTTRFPMYSTVKTPVMLTLLDQVMRAGRQLTAEEDSLVKKMIQHSDNDATSTLYYNRIGGEAAVESFLRRHGITEIDMNPSRWGLSTTTASGMARLMGKLGNCTMLNRYWCDYALSVMRNVTWDQYWGVSAGVPNVLTTRSVAIKNGWYPESGWLASGVDLAPGAAAETVDTQAERIPPGYSETVPWPADPNAYHPDATGWAINSVGFVKDGGKLYAIAAYTRPSSTMEYGIATIEGISRNVYPAIPPR